MLICIVATAVLLALSGTAEAGLTFEASSSTTISVSWTAPGDDGATGTANQYDIRYSTSLITEANWASASQASGEPSPSSPGSSEAFTLTGLTPLTTYYIAIKASDEVPNWSAISNVVLHTTCDSPSEPTLFSPADGLTNLTQPIVLDWSTEPTATSYEVQVDDNSNFSSPAYDQSRASSYITISGLDLETRYYWRVRSVNSCGPSAWTNVWDFVTQSLISGAEDITASTDTVYGTSRPTLTLWNAVGSESNRYYFEVSEDSSFLPSTVITRSDDVTEESDGSASWTLDQSLSGGREYFWRVALNSEGYSTIFKFSVNPAELHVYPSPFSLSRSEFITFTEVPPEATLVVTTLMGEVVKEWPGTTGEDIQWDGRNDAGREVAPGVYYWFIREGEQKGKFSIVVD